MSSHYRQEEERRQLIGFGRALRQARVQAGLSERDLAAATGRTARYIRRLEAGKLDPPYDLMIALADRLGVPLHILVGEAERLSTESEMPAPHPTGD